MVLTLAASTCRCNETMLKAEAPVRAEEDEEDEDDEEQAEEDEDDEEERKRESGWEAGGVAGLIVGTGTGSVDGTGSVAGVAGGRLLSQPSLHAFGRFAAGVMVLSVGCQVSRSISSLGSCAWCQVSSLRNV
jgi:hypothetical protein